jgi:2,3-bisphosphoglycerate-independent phosphoglycerate mutase
MDRPRPVALIVLDGWGERDEEDSNAVEAARTPVMDRLRETRPFTYLRTSGEAVGLPKGQMGNSEVGHLNLGAGRVVHQDYMRINKAVGEGTLAENPRLLDLFEAVGETKTLHLFGLVSPGGVHSHQDHAAAVARAAREAGVRKLALHAFMDGRDTPPRSGADYLARLMKDLESIGLGEVATVSGRYYAMDRDNRWDRTERAYRAMAFGESEIRHEDPVAGIRASYDNDITDEFIEPFVVTRDGGPVATIEDGDGVLFFNFRADRARQLTRAFTEDGFDAFDRGKSWDLHFTTMTRYHQDFTLPVLFPEKKPENILADVLEEAGLTNLRIAETEKYPHVTFFFNGGRDHEYPGESRVLVPSPKVATYDLQPEMSAPEVCDAVVNEIGRGEHDVVILNYANCDMVGHTGDFDAAVKAVETVDACLGRTLEAVEKSGGVAIVTADHGNAEQMWDPETNGPHTAHTLNPVVCVLFDPRGGEPATLREGGVLADVAPTMLQFLGLAQPSEMTGETLIEGGLPGA